MRLEAPKDRHMVHMDYTILDMLERYNKVGVVHCPKGKYEQLSYTFSKYEV